MIKKISDFFRPYPGLLLALFIIGIILRVIRYSQDSALWLDEAWVALDICNRSFFEILTSENYPKPVPLGFALLTKLIVSLLGNTEYSFRLIPFLSGVISLALFLKFLQRFADGKAIPVAFGFFVFCEPLIYYSAELKYYSSDVMIALWLYLVAYAGDGMADPKRMIAYALTAAAAVWFSHTSLFVIVSIAILFYCHYRKSPEMRSRFWAVQLLWVVSFMFVYFISLQKVDRFGGLHSMWMWKEHFWPWPPWKWESLVWLWKSFWDLFAYPGGFHYPFLAGCAFLAGLAVVWHKNKERFWAFVLPFMIALLASGLHKYPFSGRLLLFIVPFILYFIGEALGILFNRNRGVLIGGIILIGWLAFNPAQQALLHVFHPVAKEDIRPAVRFVAEHEKEGDEVFLNTSALYPFLYYFKRYDLPLKARINRIWMDDLSRDQQGSFVFWVPVISLGLEAMSIPSMELLDGEILRKEDAHEKAFADVHRAWIIISHAGEGLESYLIDCLDPGKRLGELKAPSSSVYLYDFAARP